MFERIATGWALMKQSFAVLRSDKELVLFPFISGLACLLVTASFIVPVLMIPGLRDLLQDKDAIRQQPLAYVFMFLFYVVTYFIIVFFNSALVSCALKRMAGGDPTVSYGLQEAVARLPQIAAWAVVSATVGMVLKAIESKSNMLGKLIVSLVGAGWAIATYFVVPVLVVEHVGPWDALKRSASLVRRTWGEALAGNMGLGLIIFLATLPGFALMVLGIVLAGAMNEPIAAGVGIAIGIAWIMCVSLVSSAVQSILLTALYLYASQGTAPEQFDPALLQRAFAPKK
jgi:Family of unknown function (DUF6159)